MFGVSAGPSETIVSAKIGCAKVTWPPVEKLFTVSPPAMSMRLDQVAEPLSVSNDRMPTPSTVSPTMLTLGPRTMRPNCETSMPAAGVPSANPKARSLRNNTPPPANTVFPVNWFSLAISSKPSRTTSGATNVFTGAVSDARPIPTFTIWPPPATAPATFRPVEIVERESRVKFAPPKFNVPLNRSEPSERNVWDAPSVTSNVATLSKP